jgi:class 3 adenylate cyclase
MLSGLAIDGRFGFTAIGRTVEEAAALEEATRAAVASVLASRSADVRAE